MIPTFNADGRFLFARTAVGKAAGPLSFYSGLHDGEPDVSIKTHSSKSDNDEQSTTESHKLSQTDYDKGAANLDLLIDEIDRMEEVIDQVSTLHDRFSTDVKSRLYTRDTNYALGITKFITKYFEIVEKTEPTVSATPKLATFLHTTQYTYTHIWCVNSAKIIYFCIIARFRMKWQTLEWCYLFQYEVIIMR